jgi:hypothetical protein
MQIQKLFNNFSLDQNNSDLDIENKMALSPQD